MHRLFNIFLLDEAKAKEIASAPDEPHKHDYEELIVGVEGNLEHFIDFKTNTIESPLVSFVTKGKIHRVIPFPSNGKCKMWVLRFKSEFIAETTFQLYSFYHDHATLKLEKGNCFSRITTLCEMMNEAIQQEDPDYAIVRHLLSALFTMIESERRKMGDNEHILNKTQNSTFINFLQILEENYDRSLGVEFYAEKLFMSVRNLNLICQGIMEKSVSEIIETRKLIEAKNLLVHTDKTVSEIGFELGYNEKAYFTNVFKKRTGQTPTEFREEVQQMLS